MSNIICQKTAVIEITKKILNLRYSADIPVIEVLDKKEIADIKQQIFDGIKNGLIAFSKEIIDEELKKYITSMMSNHFRKCLELNGNAINKTKKNKIEKDNSILKEYKKDIVRKYDIDITILSD